MQKANFKFFVIFLSLTKKTTASNNKDPRSILGVAAPKQSWPLRFTNDQQSANYNQNNFAAATVNVRKLIHFVDSLL